MTDAAKTTMLSRLFDGDPHVTAELRTKVRNRMASDADAPPIVCPNRRRTTRTSRSDRPRARAGRRREAHRRTRPACERGRESPSNPAIGDSAAG
jgi:hypothetical protein